MSASPIVVKLLRGSWWLKTKILFSLSLLLGWFYSTPHWGFLLHQAHLRDVHEINTSHEVHTFYTKDVPKEGFANWFSLYIFKGTKIMNWCSWWECLSCPICYLLLAAPGAVPDSGHLLGMLGLFGVKWALSLNCSLETPSSHKISRSFQFPVSYL